MSATEMFALSIGASPHSGKRNECGMCGAFAPCHPASKVIKSSFMQNDCIHGEWICWACETALNDRRSRGSFVVADGMYRKLLRCECWPLLWNPPVPPFVVYFTTAGKKHGLFLSRPASDRNGFWVQCDHLGCWYWHVDRPWMEKTGHLLISGVRRDSLESGSYCSGDYMAVGCDAIRKYEEDLSGIRKTTKHAVLFGIMPSKEDLKKLL